MLPYFRYVYYMAGIRSYENKRNIGGRDMDKRTAFKIARDRAMRFACPFFIVDLGNGWYDVANRTTHLDKIVGCVQPFELSSPASSGVTRLH